MKAVLSDQDFLSELRRGKMGRDLERERQEQRAENIKRLIAERAALVKKFDAEFPKLERAEEATLVEFREASERLEIAKTKANASYFAKEAARAAFDKAHGALNGEIIGTANPLWRDLAEKLRRLAEDARKIPRLSEEREEMRGPNILSLSKGKSRWTNRAAITARQLLPSRIINALEERVMSGRDSDEILRTIYERGVDALPGPDVLRFDDQISTSRSPMVEAAVEDFRTRLDAALEGAING